MTNTCYLPYSRSLVERVASLTPWDPTTRGHPSFFGEPDFQFCMDPETEILASCAGVIADIREDRNIIGNEGPLVLHKTNLVVVSGSDGIRAEYVHVYPSVREGQVVNPGDKLGQLGGWSSQYGPHLHLQFYCGLRRRVMNIGRLEILER